MDLEGSQAKGSQRGGEKSWYLTSHLGQMRVSYESTNGHLKRLRIQIQKNCFGKIKCRDWNELGGKL